MFYAVTGILFPIKLSQETSGTTFQMAIPSSQVANITCVYQGKKDYLCAMYYIYKIFYYDFLNYEKLNEKCIK